MREAVGPYQIIRLHSLSERCWGVIDAKGALCTVAGALAMRMTKLEAIALAEMRNAPQSVQWRPRVEASVQRSS